MHPELLIRLALSHLQEHRRPPAGGWVTLRTALRHDDLAAMIAATRVSVSSAVAALRREETLEGTRGSYRLRPALLREVAEGGGG